MFNMKEIILLVLTLLVIFERISCSSHIASENFRIIDSGKRKGIKNVEPANDYKKFFFFMRIQHCRREILWLISRKKLNKLAHISEGNRKNEYLHCAFWNNKSGQNHLGSSTKDNLAVILLKHDIDIIGISESNILKDDAVSKTKIKGYDTVNDKLMSNYGKSRSAIYIKSKLKYNVRSDLMDDDSPEVWVEVCLKRGKYSGENILFCQYYREQSELRGNHSRAGSESLASQKERLRKWMRKVASKVLSENKRIYVGGDFNASIGVNEETKDSIGADLEETLVCEAGLDMIIKEATHQEVRKGTQCKPRTIDHLYTNSPEKTTNTKVLDQAGTHHKLLMTRIMDKPMNKAPLQHKGRQRKLYSKEKYLEELDGKDWKLPEESPNREENIAYLKELVQRLTWNLRSGLDSICPLVTLNRRVKQDPWLLEHEVVNQSEKEKESWMKWKENATDESLKRKYNTEKENTKKIIKEKRGHYLRNKIINDGGDDKSLWKNVKDSLNWRQDGPPTELRNGDGKLESDLKKVADIFHDALESKVNNIANSLKCYEETEEEEAEAIRNAGIERGRDEFNFGKVTEEEIEKVIGTLPRKTSSGDDQVSYIEIKDASFYVVPMMTRIINLIIETSYWPKAWSNSIIKPLFKGDSSPLEASSYRPVALTCALSRVTEKLLSSQLTEYLLKNKLIGDEYHGFLPRRGTGTGVIEILEQLQASVDDGGVAVLLGCDISSAFDVLSRKKCLRQLFLMGASTKTINLFEDYFRRRTQQVEIGIQRGEKRPSYRGVLQGSGLSPVLFLIYFLRAGVANRQCPMCKEELKKRIEERKNNCNRCGSSIVYADDLNIISKVKSFGRNYIERMLSTQGNRINSTLRKISLSMNRKKSQFMCAMTSQRRKASRLTKEERENRCLNLITTIGDTQVTESESVKTLGIQFDNQLNFRNYWEENRKKIQRKSYALRYLKNDLSFLDRKKLAQGLVLSKIEYCLEATSSCPKSILKLAGRQLSRTVREVTGVWDYEETESAYKAAGWLNIEELAIWRTLKTGLAVLRNKSPKGMYDRLTEEKSSGRSVKPTRKFRTAIGNRTFSSRFCRIWAILSNDVKTADLTSKVVKDRIKREIATWDKDWVLWGKENEAATHMRIQKGPGDLDIDLPDDLEDFDNGMENESRERVSSATTSEEVSQQFSPQQRMAMILAELNERKADTEEMSASDSCNQMENEETSLDEENDKLKISTNKSADEIVKQSGDILKFIPNGWKTADDECKKKNEETEDNISQQKTSCAKIDKIKAVTNKFEDEKAQAIENICKIIPSGWKTTDDECEKKSEENKDNVSKLKIMEEENNQSTATTTKSEDKIVEQTEKKWKIIPSGWKTADGGCERKTEENGDKLTAAKIKFDYEVLEQTGNFWKIIPSGWKTEDGGYARKTEEGEDNAPKLRIDEGGHDRLTAEPNKFDDEILEQAKNIYKIIPSGGETTEDNCEKIDEVNNDKRSKLKITEEENNKSIEAMNKSEDKIDDQTEKKLKIIPSGWKTAYNGCERKNEENGDKLTAAKIKFDYEILEQTGNFWKTIPSGWKTEDGGYERKTEEGEDNAPKLRIDETGNIYKIVPSGWKATDDRCEGRDEESNDRMFKLRTVEVENIESVEAMNGSEDVIDDQTEKKLKIIPSGWKAAEDGCESKNEESEDNALKLKIKKGTSDRLTAARNEFDDEILREAGVFWKIIPSGWKAPDWRLGAASFEWGGRDEETEDGTSGLRISENIWRVVPWGWKAWNLPKEGCPPMIWDSSGGRSAGSGLRWPNWGGLPRGWIVPGGWTVPGGWRITSENKKYLLRNLLPGEATKIICTGHIT